MSLCKRFLFCQNATSANIPVDQASEMDDAKKQDMSSVKLNNTSTDVLPVEDSVTNSPTIPPSTTRRGSTHRDRDVEILVFTPEDPTDPKNWSKGRKLGVIVILCFLSFCS